jgi:hypothetical protein
MKNFLVISVLFVFFCSCAKEYSYEGGRRPDSSVFLPPAIKDSAVKDTSSLVKHYTEKRGSQVDEYDFHYDSQGRLISKISTSADAQYIYRYNSDNTFTMDFFKGGLLSVHEKYYLNKQNLVDSMVQINYETKDTSSVKNIYNTSKLLVQVKDYSIKSGIPVLTKTTLADYDANGNVTREYNTNGNQIAYEYSNLPYNLNIGLNYFSRNTNLYITSTYSGARNVVLKHSYIFDDENRLTSETVIDSNGNVIVTKTYGY